MSHRKVAKYYMEITGKNTEIDSGLRFSVLKWLMGRVKHG